MVEATLSLLATLLALQVGPPLQWIDAFMDSTMRRAQVAGALVVVVHADSVLLARGFGLADVERRIPVDPARTGFRLGSVSKLITATAVMQLVEEGKLDLDRDVNDYLDFRLDSPWPAPITLRHLLTHSAGFANVLKGLGYVDPAIVVPLAEHARRYQPPVEYPPGTTPAYSNYGFVLSGYLIQRIAGMPFEQYLAQRIFAPLDMTRTTFVQPLPAELERDMSRGYVVASGPAQPFEILGTMPAGAGTTTGTNIARFMLAHLNAGSVGAGRILKPETILLMHREAELPPGPPGFGGMALGFTHSGDAEPVQIGHGGDTVAFHTGMALFLASGLGVFIAVNSQGVAPIYGDGVVSGFLDEFSSRLPRAVAETPQATGTAREHAAQAAGRYIPSRHFERSFLALLNLRADRLSANPDGTISIASLTDRQGKPKTWRETGPWLWQEVGGSDRLAMTLEDGRVTMIRRSNDAATVLVRASGARRAAWNIPLLIATIAVLALELVRRLVLGVNHLVRRRGAIAREPLVHRLGKVGPILAAAALSGWVYLIYGLMSGQFGLISGTEDPTLRLLQVTGALAVLLLPAVVASTLATVRASGLRGAWSVLVCGACLAFAWFAFAFDLLGPSLSY